MKYYIIAGEPSGDLHGSNLLINLIKKDQNAEIRFWGGDLMQEALEQGKKEFGSIKGEMVKHYKETAVMGVWDVITHLGKIRKNFVLCRKDIKQFAPDALILIDYPGFNLPMAKFGKQNGCKVLYYISPKVWASKEHRVEQMKKYIDRLFTIFPFETPYFAKHGMTANYCGNPVMDAIAERPGKDETREEFCKRNNINCEKPILALLAGSRKSEISYNLPLMLKCAAEHPECTTIIAGAPSFNQLDYEKYLEEYPTVRLLFGETYNILAHSRAAMVTSGTATLETALLGCPQVVLYKMWGGWFSDWVAHLFIKVKYISLVNLILDEEVVEELFQKKYSDSKLRELVNLLLGETPYRQKMLSDYEVLKKAVGPAGCSKRAAELMYNYMITHK